MNVKLRKEPAASAGVVDSGGAGVAPVPPLQIAALRSAHTVFPGWRVLVCCVCLIRTRRVTAEPYFWALMKAYPTPMDAADAEEGAIAEILRPSGFGNVKERMIRPRRGACSAGTITPSNRRTSF